MRDAARLEGRKGEEEEGEACKYRNSHAREISLVQRVKAGGMEDHVRPLRHSSFEDPIRPVVQIIHAEVWVIRTPLLATRLDRLDGVTSTAPQCPQHIRDRNDVRGVASLLHAVESLERSLPVTSSVAGVQGTIEGDGIRFETTRLHFSQ